jgi:broad specificity phosphatase PhoE
MDPPAITRRRRPFLAPVWVILLAILAVVGVGLALHQSATNTIVMIVSPASRELGTIDNPPLSAEGEQQAEQLAREFASSTGAHGLAAIFVGKSRGAEQTAAPLAELLHTRPLVLRSGDAGGIAAQIMGEHEGDNVLVVCAADTIPQLVNELTGESIAAATAADPRALYVVTVPSYGPASVLRMRY